MKRRRISASTQPGHQEVLHGPSTSAPAKPLKRDFFIDHLVVTNRVRISLKRWILSVLGNRRTAIEHDHDRIGWTTPNPDHIKYRPLGVEGGVARSL